MAVYKEVAACKGSLSTTRCSLRPAILEQRVVVINNTVELDPETTFRDDSLVEYVDGRSPGSDVSTHGGVALALNLQYKAAAHLRFTGAVGWETDVQGYAALQYASGLDYLHNCTSVWVDPTGDMLATARALAFRVAIGAANLSEATNIHTVRGTREESMAIYSSNYAYLGAAVGTTLLISIFIIPLFLGWWHLGRKVFSEPGRDCSCFWGTCAC